MLAPIENLVRNLGRLPGLGRRSAGRAALALVREPDRLLEPLVLALRDAQANVCACARCGAFTVRGEDPCALCTDATRDGGVVCVVEEAADVVTIESSGAFRGRYHVLAGKLSPVRHCGPDKLRIAELKDRIAREGFGEVLLALSTDIPHRTRGVRRGPARALHGHGRGRHGRLPCGGAARVPLRRRTREGHASCLRTPRRFRRCLFRSPHVAARDRAPLPRVKRKTARLSLGRSKNGARDGARSRNPQIHNLMLYQLSYSRHRKNGG